jgi:hypothetical protein
VTSWGWGSEQQLEGGRVNIHPQHAARMHTGTMTMVLDSCNFSPYWNALATALAEERGGGIQAPQGAAPRGHQCLMLDLGHPQEEDLQLRALVEKSRQKRGLALPGWHSARPAENDG